MPINLSKAQNQVLSSGLLERLGTTGKFETFVANNILEQYGEEFVSLLSKYMKERKITASGALADNIIPEISEDGKKLTISLLDYYDFVNEGVKGWADSSNAPDSPYRFRTKGMNKEGRASIKRYILSGKAKVRNVRNDKAAGFKSESKGIKFNPKKTLIEKQVDTLVWLIKKYGIKKTDYFTDAFEKAFANLEQDLAKAVELDIELFIDLKTKKKY